jgi:hypothetical protein
MAGTVRLVACWEVSAGLIPGRPDGEFTRRWPITSPDWHQLGDDARRAAYLKASDEAHDYAKSLEDPRRINWVRVDWIWL